MSDEVYCDVYEGLMAPYREHVRQLEKELADELEAHRLCEAQRLKPFQDRVAGLLEEDGVVSAQLDCVQDMYERAREEENAHLAPLRAHATRSEVYLAEACRAYTARVNGYSALAEDVVRARRGVVVAAGALGPLSDLPPEVALRLAALEAARDVERGLLLRLARHSHEGYLESWTNWQYPSMERAVRLAREALRYEQTRPGAPPLAAMHKEFTAVKSRQLSVRLALVSAQKALRDQTEAGAAAWDVVAVRLNGAISTAAAELEEAVPGIRLRASLISGSSQP